MSSSSSSDTKNNNQQQQHPEFNPDIARCSFWNTKRKQFCKFQVRRGYKFCSLHQNDDSDDQEKKKSNEGEQDISNNTNMIIPKRIPCPINPNHTIFEKDLQKHIKVCPDARFDVTKLPFYCKGLHTGEYLIKNTTTSSRNSENDNNNSTSTSIPIRRDEKFSSQMISHRQLNSDQLLSVWKLIVNVFREFVAPDLFPSDDTNNEKDHHRHQFTPMSWILKSLHVSCDDDDDDEESFSSSLSLYNFGDSSSTQRSSTSKKHGLQHQGLVRLLSGGNMNSNNNAVNVIRSLETSSFRNPDVFVELGAGKGGLALAVADAVVQDRRRSCRQAVSASRGGTSTTTPAPMPAFVVVDRGGFRRKADGKVGKDDDDVVTGDKTETNSSGGDHQLSSSVKYPTFQRVRIDVQDMDLFKIPIDAPAQKSNNDKDKDNRNKNDHSSSSSLSACVIGKHLCGACTDFTISACFNRSSTTSSSPVGARNTISEVDTILIATCCHHRCEKKYFEFLIDSLLPPVTNEEIKEDSIDNENQYQRSIRSSKLRRCFNMINSDAIFGPLVSLTSWATCGHARSTTSTTKNNKDDDDDDEHGGNENENEVDLPERREREEAQNEEELEKTTTISLQDLLNGDELTKSIPSTPTDRERAGRMCKLILDWMRCRVVIERGEIKRTGVLDDDERCGSSRLGIIRHAKLIPFLPGDTEVTKENWCILAY